MDIVKVNNLHEIPTGGTYQQYAGTVEDAVEMFIRRYKFEPDVVYVTCKGVIMIPYIYPIINFSEVLRGL